MQPGHRITRPGTITARTLRAAVERGLREHKGRRLQVSLTERPESFTYPGGATGLRAHFTASLPDGSFGRGVAVFTRHYVGRPGAGTLDVRVTA